MPRKSVRFTGNGSVKRQRAFVSQGTRFRNMGYERKRGTRVGYGSVARTRGAAVTGEMKYFDCDRTSTAIALVTTTWVAGTIMDPGTTIDLGGAAVATPACLFAPTVGSALNQRVGRQVHVKKLKIHGTVIIANQTAQTSADAANKIRILLVQDMQTNAAQMTGAQLMRDGTSADTTINSFQNPNNFGRFRVLKDKIIILQDPNIAGEVASTNLTLGGLKFNFKFAINFKVPICVRFNATNGGTVADIIDNSFHFLIATDATGLAPTCAYYSRVSYKE